MKYAILIVGLVLAGCQTLYDNNGFLYPPECRGDLSAVSAPILISPREAIGGDDGRYDYVSGTILIADDLAGSMKEDVIRHERCHAIAGRWHPE